MGSRKVERVVHGAMGETVSSTSRFGKVQGGRVKKLVLETMSSLKVAFGNVHINSSNSVCDMLVSSLIVKDSSPEYVRFGKLSEV